MKIRDILKETPSTASIISVFKNGKPIDIKAERLPPKPQYHHINQELKRLFPKLNELDRMNLARDLIKKNQVSFKGYDFLIQGQKPKEMKW